MITDKLFTPEEGEQLRVLTTQIGGEIGAKLADAMVEFSDTPDGEVDPSRGLVLFTHTMAEVIGNIAVTVCCVGQTPNLPAAYDAFVNIAVGQIASALASARRRNLNAAEAVQAEMATEEDSK